MLVFNDGVVSGMHFYGRQGLTHPDCFQDSPSAEGQADVQVLSGETVVLGGLAQNSVTKSTTKVPLLGDIPLLGWLFRHESDEKVRNEIIVFLTPRVIDTPAQMEDDARNAKAALGTDGLFDPTISASRIADPLSEKAARRVLENGRETVAPQRYPSTGALTGLNDPAALGDDPAAAAIRGELDRAAAEDRLPYIHYSEVETATRTPAAAEPETEEHGEDGEEPAAAEPVPGGSGAEPPSVGEEESRAEPAESDAGASAPGEPPADSAEPPAAEVVLAPAADASDDLVTPAE